MHNIWWYICIRIYFFYNIYIYIVGKLGIRFVLKSIFSLNFSMEGFIWTHGECRGFSHCSTTALVAFPSIKLRNLNGCTLFPKKKWTSKMPSWIHLVLGLFTRNPSLESPGSDQGETRASTATEEVRQWCTVATLSCISFHPPLLVNRDSEEVWNKSIWKFAGDDPFTSASVHGKPVAGRASQHHLLPTRQSCPGKIFGDLGREQSSTFRQDICGRISLKGIN